MSRVEVRVPSSRSLRSLAEIEFVVDPDNRPLRYHYEREDRDYKNVVEYATFAHWAAEDGWIEKRLKYQEEAKARIITAHLAQDVQRRLREIDDIEENELKFIREWVRPLKDPVTGEVLRHPEYDANGNPHKYAGLPMFGVKFNSLESALSALTKREQHVMLKRGDPTSRSEARVEHTDGPAPEQIMLQKVSKDEIQAMARALLLQRQPELLKQDVIDIEPETKKDDEDGGDTI